MYVLLQEFYFRLKIWVKNCGSEDVGKQPINDLHGKYYLCSDHFLDKYFISHEKKRLINTAIPTVFHAKNNCDHASSNSSIQHNNLDLPSTSGQSSHNTIKQNNYNLVSNWPNIYCDMFVWIHL
jgi:hypothetical protein